MQPQFNDVPVVVPGAPCTPPTCRPAVRTSSLRSSCYQELSQTCRSKSVQDTCEPPPQLTTLHEPVQIPTRQVWPFLAPSNCMAANSNEAESQPKDQRECTCMRGREEHSLRDTEAYMRGRHRLEAVRDSFGMLHALACSPSKPFLDTHLLRIDRNWSRSPKDDCILHTPTRYIRRKHKEKTVRPFTPTRRAFTSRVTSNMYNIAPEHQREVVFL
jgi:hypothetical protein